MRTEWKHAHIRRNDENAERERKKKTIIIVRKISRYDKKKKIYFKSPERCGARLH